jgi:outer membrane PBP1 activator LpoA protein
MMLRAITFCATAALILLLLGCGGGSDDSPIPKEEFTEQLQAVCKEGREKRQQLLKALSKEYYEERAARPTDSYQAKNLRKLMAIIGSTTAEIAAIGPLEGKEKQVEEWIRLREEATAKVEASPLGTRDNLQAIFEATAARSKALGLGTCDL